MIHIPISDSFRSALGDRAKDEAQLTRWSLEALVIEAYREDLISRSKKGELLDLQFHEREAWLKERDVPYLYELSDYEDDKRALDKLFGALG